MSYKPGRVTVAATLLSFLLSAVPIGPAVAALIPTDSLLVAQEVSADRALVDGFLAREDVQNALSKYGVDRGEAAARVAALSDEEVRDIAARINELPAGQDSGAAIVGVVLTVFIILLITDLLCLTTIFNFTRCAR